jgi:hypothetical protein
MEDDEWAILDRHVLGVVQLTLSRTIAHNIVKEKTTTGLMTALLGMYEKLYANKSVHLVKKLLNLKITKGIPVA